MEVRIDKFTMAQLGQYEKTYKIIEGYENQAGEFKPSFCKRETGPRGNRTEKVMPVSVKLGEKDVATFALLRFLKEITGLEYGPKESADDAPF